MSCRYRTVICEYLPKIPPSKETETPPAHFGSFLEVPLRILQHHESKLNGDLYVSNSCACGRSGRKTSPQLVAITLQQNIGSHFFAVTKISLTQHQTVQTFQMTTEQTDSERFLQGLLRLKTPRQDRTLSAAVRCALSYIPQQQTYQLPEPNTSLLSSDKALLTRKANQLFGLGQIQAAEKIYLAVGYNAGLQKLADYYLEKHDFIKAYLLLEAANNQQKADELIERFVAVLQKWLNPPADRRMQREPRTK